MDYDFVDQSVEGGFLHFWGVEGVEESSLEGRNIGEFWGGVCVISVLAGAIGGVDIAVEAAVGIQSSLFFHTIYPFLF